MSTAQLTGDGSGLQEVGALQASHVYILWHSSANLLKIGKANSVLDRAKAFGLDSIDLGSSVALRLKSVAQAVHVEKTLHRTFKKWSVSKDNAIAAGIGNDGATEWFSTECRDRLFAYLETNSDLFDFTLVSSDALRDLLEARLARRIEFDRMRLEQNAQKLNRVIEQDVRRQSKEARRIAQKLDLERQLTSLARLFEVRMKAVDDSPDAVFLGCSAPSKDRFELLFLSRPSFVPEGRDSVWVGMLEGSVHSDFGGSNLISSTAASQDDFCSLEQVNVSFRWSCVLGYDFSAFAKFIDLLRSRPLEAAFFESTAREICDAADCFFEAKQIQPRAEKIVSKWFAEQSLQLFAEEGSGLNEIVKSMNEEMAADCSLSSVCYQQP